jgi:hypothetical protein
MNKNNQRAKTYMHGLRGVVRPQAVLALAWGVGRKRRLK